MPVRVATLIVEDVPDAVARAAGGLHELGVTWEQVHRVPSESGVQHWQVALVDHPHATRRIDNKSAEVDPMPGRAPVVVDEQDDQNDGQLPLPGSALDSASVDNGSAEESNAVQQHRRIQMESAHSSQTRSGLVSANESENLVRNPYDQKTPSAQQTGLVSQPVSSDQLIQLPGVIGLLEESNLSPRQGWLGPWPRPDVGAGGRVTASRKLGQNASRRVTDAQLRESRKQSAVALNAQDLIPPLVAKFPAIERLIVELDRQSRSVPERDSLYHDIGVRTGRCLAVTHPRIHQAESIEDALQHTIIGLLFPLARARVSGTVLQVHQSHFLRAASGGLSGVRDRLFSPYKTRAAFIAGVIKGILNHGEKLPNVDIETSTSRYQGATHWLFTVRAI